MNCASEKWHIKNVGWHTNAGRWNTKPHLSRKFFGYPSPVRELHRPCRLSFYKVIRNFFLHLFFFLLVN